MLDPVKVVITNLTSSDDVTLDVPNIPHLPDKGTHSVPFDPCDLYIDRSDLREVGNKIAFTIWTPEMRPPL